MAAAMATGSCQGVQVVATCIVDSPLAASTSIAAAHFRQKAWFRAGAQQTLCMNEWYPQVRSGGVVTRAMAAENLVPAVKEKYEVELEKPFGLKFYKGADGGASGLDFLSNYRENVDC